MYYSGLISVVLVFLVLSTSYIDCALVHSPKTIARLFDRRPVNPQDATCCLPQVYSYSSTHSQQNNNEFSSESFRVSFDLVNKKMRYDIVSLTDPHYVFTNIMIGSNDSMASSYNIFNNSCVCVSQPFIWGPVCLDKGYTAEKVKILELDGTRYHLKQKIVMDTVVAVRSGTMKANECYYVSSTTHFQWNGGGKMESQEFYNMSEKVDPSVFNLPSICPSFC